MGQIIIQHEDVNNVEAPPAGKSTLVLDANQLKSKHSDGSVRVYSTGITPEEVQDIVAQLMADSPTMQFLYDDPNNTLTVSVKNGSITNSYLASGIDAVKIGSGSVSNTEFGYLGGVSGSIQTQINSKENSGVAAALISNHESSVDPHPQYTTTSEAALAAPVQSVAGKTGAVTLVKTDIGLSNVDNTSDLNKPISTATQTALNGKENTITAGTASQYWRGDKTWQTLDKTAVGLSNVDNTSDLNKPISTATQTALNGKASTSLLGAPNGIPLMGADTKILGIYLPSYVDDVLEFSALSAFPVTGDSGKIYLALDTNLQYRWSGSTYVGISSNLALGETAATAYRGDRGKIAYDHSLIIGNPHGTTKTDIGLSNVDNTSDLNKPLSTATQTALDGKANSSHTHTSTNITDLAEAVQDTVGSSLVNTASIAFGYNDTSNTITANAIPSGIDHNSLQNYTLQRHIDHSAVSITAGSGLTGGGDLTSSRTIAIATTGVTASSYGAATAVPSFTVNALGQLTAASNTPILIPSSQVSDFAESIDDRVAALIVAGSGISVAYNDPSNTLTIATTLTQYTDEQAQDAVGNVLTDSPSINFTYNDTYNTITANAIPSGIDHDALSNFVTSKHIDHSAVSITAGSGLTGGGDLTSSRTISMPNIGSAGTYGAANAIPVITTDAQGRVTSITSVSNNQSQWVNTEDGIEWANQTNDNLIIRQATNDPTQSAFMEQIRSRGTLAVPLQVQSGDKLGGQTFVGWTTSGKAPRGAEFAAYATQAHTPSATGTEFRIYTVANDTTSEQLRMTIKDGGDVVVSNGITVGNTTAVSPGTFRYTNGEAQVRDASAWRPIAPTPTYLYSTSAVSTTSSTWNKVSSMELTPVSGTYVLSFSASCSIDNDSNGDFSVFIGGNQVAVTQRTISCTASGSTSGAMESSVSITTLITVNGSQDVSIRYRENSNGTLRCYERELVLVPVAR